MANQARIESIARQTGNTVEYIASKWDDMLAWDREEDCSDARLIEELHVIESVSARYREWAKTLNDNDDDGAEQADYVGWGNLAALAAASRELK